MRRLTIALAALLLAAPFFGVVPGTERTASAEVSVSVFYDSLSPYGEWVTVGGVGPVWRPHEEVVGADFRPYATNGYWVDTEYGWSFESEYEWGWAPFHYGRWFYHPRFGWVWKPGRTWGPAWVDWRFGGGYVGWAPLPPSGISVVYRSEPRWYFVDTPHFTDRRVWVHAVPQERARQAWSVTVPSRRPITYRGARWNAGPPPTRVAQVQGRPVERVHVQPPRPGQVVRVQAQRPNEAVPQRTAPVQQQPTRVVPSQRPDTPRVAPSQRPEGRVQPQPAQPPQRTVPAQRPDGPRAQPQPAQQPPPRVVPSRRPDGPPSQQPSPRVVPSQRPDGQRAQPQPQQPPRVVPSNRPAPTHAAPPPQQRPQPQQRQEQPQPQPQPNRPPPQKQQDDRGRVHDQRH